MKSSLKFICGDTSTTLLASNSTPLSLLSTNPCHISRNIPHALMLARPLRWVQITAKPVIDMTFKSRVIHRSSIDTQGHILSRPNQCFQLTIYSLRLSSSASQSLAPLVLARPPHATEHPYSSSLPRCILSLGECFGGVALSMSLILLLSLLYHFKLRHMPLIAGTNL